MAPSNPFQPGRGVAPPVLAGREVELQAAEKCLKQLERGRMPSRDLLFFGPRGNGKTALLMEIADRARARGLRVEVLPVDALQARGTLVREPEERGGHVRDRVTGLHLGPLGGEADRAKPSENVHRFLSDWIGRLPEPLVIELDEVQALDVETGGSFFGAVQAARSGSQPFLLICAGTPDAPRQLRQAATHNERGFHRFRVGRLSDSDAATALSEPARQAGRPMATDAAVFLADAAQGYPFFIQLLGSAAWETAAADAGMIGLDAAREGAGRAREEIEDFYGERFAEADERGVEPALGPLARLFSQRNGSVEYPELRGLLADVSESTRPPVNRIALLNTLRDLGVIWETSPRVWEMGIPSFAEHILRHGGARVGD